MVIRGLWCFHTNFRIICFSSVKKKKKCHGYCDSDCIESVDCLERLGHFNNILSVHQHSVSFYLCHLQFHSFFCVCVYEISVYLFWLCWVFIAARAFSSCASRGYSLVAVCRLLIAASHCGLLMLEHRQVLGCMGFSSCDTRAHNGM